MENTQEFFELCNDVFGVTVFRQTHFDGFPNFHDWNWIMNIVEAIENLPPSEFHGKFIVYIGSNSCTIQGTKLRIHQTNNHYAYFNCVTSNTKQQSTIEAIFVFLNWYKHEVQNN